MGLINKIFGTRSQREVKALTPIVDKIEALSDEYKALSDQQPSVVWGSMPLWESSYSTSSAREPTWVVEVPEAMTK